MRKFEPTDYEQLVRWWNKWEFPPPPLSLLPPTGYIIPGLAAGFMYLTDAPIGWMEWVVCNPDADKKERSKALDEVINKLDAFGKSRDKVVSFTSSNSESYISRLKRLGYVVGDVNTTQLMRNLK